MHYKYIFVILFTLLPVGLHSQTAIQQKSEQNQAMEEVSKSLENDAADYTLAKGYMRLTETLILKDEYAKAEEYLAKVKAIYVKHNDKVKIASVNREIAKVQEAQKKYKQAISSYTSASQMSPSVVDASVNANDASRLKNRSNPQAQSDDIQRQIKLLESTDKVSEKTTAYQQLAEANLKLDKKDDAIKNLNTALASASDKPEVAIKIEREIANVYSANQEHEKAKEIGERLLADARDVKNTRAEIEQLQALSSIYFEDDNKMKGVNLLQQAYTLAIERGHTMEARNSLQMLADRYKKEKQPEMALELYGSFLTQLEPLIKSDSALIEAKFFQVHERKITQLEKERELKDELIEKKNVLNYVLIGSILLILGFLGFIVKTLFAIKTKNKKIALQSLRREMNPHFIFNSLNSVNQFIAQNNELEANKYLFSYSKLMRTMMENSNKDFITLSTELTHLKEYLDLEYLRFQDKFTYKINVDNDLDADAIMVPNMLIQPQLENAIWHGLRYTESGGYLNMTVKAEGDNTLCVLVEDNGIGLKKSKELKTKHQKSHNSRGLTNTYERISLLNSIYKTNISITFTDKAGDETGVIVTLRFPLVNK